MNQQLTLIEANAPFRPKKSKQLPKKRSARITRKLDAERKAQAWWKLSNEEREQGLAGVRAIRAILQNASVTEQSKMAKAS